jgi:hypothetical protein
LQLLSLHSVTLSSVSVLGFTPKCCPDNGMRRLWRGPEFPLFAAVPVLPLQYGVPEPGRVFRACGECLRFGGKRGCRA